MKYLTAKLAALMSFGKGVDFSDELLPASAETNANSVRNRVIRVGRHIERDGAKAKLPPPGTPAPEIVVRLDGGYVRGRRGPERNFEVVAGKGLAGETATRFALVREGSSAASLRVQQAMVSAGRTDGSTVTGLSDGDAGLRAIQRKIGPESEPILDWFHLAMRFQHLIQMA